MEYITITEFEKLPRGMMLAELRRVAPERARGKSRAKREDLFHAYSEFMAGLLSALPPATTLKVEDKEEEPVIGLYSYAAAVLTGVPHDSVTPKQEAAARDFLRGRSTVPPPEDYVPPVLDANYAELELTTLASMRSSILPTAPAQAAKELPRKKRLQAALSALTVQQRNILLQYRRVLPNNRKATRLRNTLREKIQRFLPDWISVEEAILTV